MRSINVALQKLKRLRSAKSLGNSQYLLKYEHFSRFIQLEDPVILAPMSGVTDLPFRRLVKRQGAGLVVSEMIASQAMIRETRQVADDGARAAPRSSRWRCSSPAASRR